MKAEYCVDYLSHKWTSDDLLHTYRETRKEYKRHVMSHLLLSNQSTITAGDEKTLNGERTKLLRFQNALWREMARNCTNKLSQSNEMIHPSSVSWQKESDITWFYGPMYTDRIDKDDNKLHASVQAYSVPSLQGLKPVLKKQSNVTRLLPSCSDSICSMDNNSLWSKYTSGYGSPITEYGNSLSSSSRTSYCNSRNNSISSICSSNSKNSVGVHFNPEIIEIEYQPEYPVSIESKMAESINSRDSYKHDPYYFDDEEEEEDDDDVLWSLLVHSTTIFKAFLFFQFNILTTYLLSRNNSPDCSHSNSNNKNTSRHSNNKNSSNHSNSNNKNTSSQSNSNIKNTSSHSNNNMKNSDSNNNSRKNTSSTINSNSKYTISTENANSNTKSRTSGHPITLVLSLATSCTSLITMWIIYTSITPLLFMMRLLSSSLKFAASAGQQQQKKRI